MTSSTRAGAVSTSERTSSRSARPRTYLMCPPEHFAVQYAINAWMDTSVAVDPARATKQWSALKDLYQELGHTVHVLEAAVDLPDMVFSANGAFSVDGVVYGATFAYPQRAAEAGAHRAWYLASGWDLVDSRHTNEGEGDFAYLPDRGLILAGYGFRTESSAHAEAQEALGRQVVSLRLIDERFYHLDLALFALDDANVCYYPGAFSPSSRRILARLFPDAIIASETDALAFGLNSVSDGQHVVIAAAAEELSTKLAQCGYVPIAIDLSELAKGGGGAKCCTAELRTLGYTTGRAGNGYVQE